MKSVRLLAMLAAGLGSAGVAFAETSVPTDTATENAFLDILPKVDVPEVVTPIPDALNVEFRNCRALWPTEYVASQKGPEARAYRDIYGLVKVSNVIETRDCSCTGKVAAWSDVEAIAVKLRDLAGVKSLGFVQTEAVYKESSALFPVAEKMCAGKF